MSTRAAALSIVEKETNAPRQVTLFKALGVAAIALACLVGFLVRGTDHVFISGIGPTGNMIFSIAVITFAFAIAGYMFVQYHQARPARDHLYRTLHDDPSRVVWIYEVPVYAARSDLHLYTEFHFGFSDRSLHSLNVARVNVERLRAGLYDVCPRAVREYSDHIAETFHSNPGLLVGGRV